MIETQLDLLSDSPIARMRDPDTSHEAAEKITKSGVRAGQQQIVLGLVKNFPGQTSHELSLDSVVMDRWTIARRLPELRDAGLVRNGEKKKCDVTGLNALTWWAV